MNTTPTAERPAPIRPLSREQLEARAQHGHLPLVEDPIEALFEAAEADHDAPPVEERSWTTSRTEISYGHGLFGKIRIGVKNCSLGEPQTKGPNSWARVYAPNRFPECLEIEMTVTPRNGVKVLEFAADPSSDSDDQFVTERTGEKVPSFPVNVSWEAGKPFTRVKHRDNMDVILLNPETGTFILVEISITTRNGYLWLLAQELYCGQWVRTNKPNAEKLGVTTFPNGRYPLLVVPLYAANAYEGSDFLKTFPELGEQMAPMVIKWGSFVPHHKSVKAVWAPEPAELPEALKAKGYSLAVPQFFNGVIGYGPAECSDGVKCFVHFSAIMGADGAPVGTKGQFPIIEPMKFIALRYKEVEGKGRQATAVRVL